MGGGDSRFGSRRDTAFARTGRRAVPGGVETRLRMAVAGAAAQRRGQRDGRAFIEWAERYERGCTRGPYTDAARLADVIAPLIGRAPIAKSATLVFYGIDTITPQQRECLDVARRSRRERTRTASGKKGRECNACRIHVGTGRDPSLRALGAHRLEKNPAARIGVVVPDLAQRREMVRRSFFAQMQPNHALPGAARREPPFNISLGIALNAYPLVHDALLLLELAGRETDFANASRLVLSPYLGGADVEMAARARLDAVLRRRAPPSLSLDVLLRLMSAKNAPRAPELAQRFAQLAEFRRSDLFGPKLPSDWAKAVSQALSIGGFPGDRSLDSAEYQTLKKWHEVVAAFATLDRVAGRMGYAQACARLSRMVTDTLFQPEAQDVPIQILGALESNHLQFEHLWVTGLTEDVWPIPLRPNPFVPVRLQREAGIPDRARRGRVRLGRGTARRVRHRGLARRVRAAQRRRGRALGGRSRASTGTSATSASPPARRFLRSTRSSCATSACPSRRRTLRTSPAPRTRTSPSSTSPRTARARRRCAPSSSGRASTAPRPATSR